MVLGSLVVEAIPLALKLGLGTTETVITIVSWSGKFIYNQFSSNKKEEEAKENLNEMKMLRKQLEYLNYDIQSMKEPDFDDRVMEF